MKKTTGQGMAGWVRCLGAVIAGILLTGSAAAQQQVCNPPLPQFDSGASFVAFGPREQLLARGGNQGPAWEWALGTDTDASGQFVTASHDWVSGRSYQWTLTYSGTAATVELKDGATSLFTRTFATGMDRGNALELQVSTNPSIGADTTIAAAVTSLNGNTVSAALSQTGTNQEAAQTLYLFFPPLVNGITAQGTVALTYASLPTGARVGFSVRAGNVTCLTFPPTVSLTAPAENAVFTAPATIAVSANAADSDGTVAKVEFYEGTNLIGTDTSAPFSISWANVNPGSYTLTAKATDNQGVSATSAPVSILVNAAPTVSLTSPANGTVFTAPAAITLTATAADTDGSITQVEFFQGATLLATVTAAPYTHTLTNVASGSFSFTARATDNRGATTTSAAVAVTVNAPPTISLTSPANNATFTAPADIPVTADVADTDGTIASVAFYEGANLIATRTTPPYSIVWTGVPAGSYSLTARVTDNLGATATSAAVSVTVSAAVGQIFYIHPDHLNSPRRIYNQTQQLVWAWDQTDPFGGNPPDENPSGLGTFICNLRFPGTYADRETGTLYNWHRTLDTGIGRYIQADPLGVVLPGVPTPPRRLNQPYAYGDNNPLIFADPLGLCPCAGGTWDQEVGDFQFNVGAGGYFSGGNVNYACRSNSSLKCSGKQICIGAGTPNASVNWALGGVVFGAGDSNNLSGWSGSGLFDGWFVGGQGGFFQGQVNLSGQGGGTAVGAPRGMSGAIFRCLNYQMKCNCPTCPPEGGQQ